MNIWSTRVLAFETNTKNYDVHYIKKVVILIKDNLARRNGRLAISAKGQKIPDVHYAQLRDIYLVLGVLASLHLLNIEHLFSSW